MRLLAFVIATSALALAEDGDNEELTVEDAPEGGGADASRAEGGGAEPRREPPPPRPTDMDDEFRSKLFDGV